MLEEVPYAEITVMALARRAGVNHNSICYHFGNVDELALAMFEREMRPDLVERFARAIRAIEGGDGELLDDPASMRGFSRVRLFAGSDSGYLRGLFRSYVKHVWLERLELTNERLSEDDRLDLRFVFTGVIDIIGDRSIDGPPARLRGFLLWEIG